MQKLLVTGASGLLGLNLSLLLKERYQIIGIANQIQLRNLPFECHQRDFFEAGAAEALLSDFEPDVIIHCAAMANVDECEKAPQRAAFLNGEFPGELAGAAGKRGIPIVHISTDAVFDGKDSGADGYRETDAPAPINVYAETKLAGEQSVLAANPAAIVARVNFYGWSVSGKRSLSEFFYRNLAAGNAVSGFTDVFFNPLYVAELALTLEKLLLRGAAGLFHVFSPEHLSKFEFGQNIARRFGFDPRLVQPVSWREGGLSAVRSPNLVMNSAKIQAFLGEALPDQAACLDAFYQAGQAGLREQIQGYQAV